MKIRRAFLEDIKGSPRAQKVLAIAVLFKARMGRRSTITNFNCAKAAAITGINAGTLRKYLPDLIRQGYFERTGRKGEHMTLRSLSSKTADRNISIDVFDFSTFKTIYNSLRGFLVAHLQHKKDKLEHTLQSLHNAKSPSEHKAARKKVMRLVRGGVLKSPNDVYQDHGISYKRFATELGNSPKTAQKVVNHTIQRGWMKKKLNVRWTYLPGIDNNYTQGYHRTDGVRAFLLMSNTYCLSAELTRCFDADLPVREKPYQHERIVRFAKEKRQNFGASPNFSEVSPVFFGASPNFPSYTGAYTRAHVVW